MEDEPILALQYSTTEGYPPLLRHLKDYIVLRNIGTEDDGVLVKAAHSRSWICSQNPSLNEGETVICEAPSSSAL